LDFVKKNWYHFIGGCDTPKNKKKEGERMTFTIRLSAFEYNYLTQKALEKGISKGEYIRKKVFQEGLERT